ncbi:variant-silencing SET domain-containing protein-like [Mercenaria mercenaria]|uniref:variant-silencing SET domain-containing protein-like n=1 Tax=Mercenaria mercenaria TaxID=6596 RepID=UPI00234ED85F|nr:variant-silencing SET domain-containing protein-like [Mercenaria mercenaria]
MAKTKTMKRKEESENDKSVLCRVCGNKKAAYVRLHCRRMHALQKSVEVNRKQKSVKETVSETGDKTPLETVVVLETSKETDSGEESEWDIDSDIHIEEQTDDEELHHSGNNEDSDENNNTLDDKCSNPQNDENHDKTNDDRENKESESDDLDNSDNTNNTDKRNVNDMRTGRMFRKPTNPMLCAPKGKDPVKKTHLDSKITNKIDQDEAKEEQVDDETSQDDTETKTFQIGIHFDNETFNRSLEIVNDGNTVISSKSVVKEGLSIGNMTIQLKEFMTPDTMNRAEDIEYVIEGKELKLNIS